MNYEKKIENCKKCELYKTRRNVVFGDGDYKKAKILILGEAPGEDEDLQGIPFIGKSGSLLRLYLNKSEWERSEYFITNVICCRPPNNRKPEQKEIEACSERFDFLLESMINLKVIVCVGLVPANYILGVQNISNNLGWNSKSIIKCGISIVAYVVYHPSFLLRLGKPKEKMEQWLEGFKDVWRYIRECRT